MKRVLQRGALVGALLATALLALWPTTGFTSPSAPANLGQGNSSGQEASAASPVPVLAYYYIWFDPGSWNRAKVDYPLLGRYSSDDEKVMRQHIEWAKAVGIQGFIVSWKSTPTLNARLDKLVSVAQSENFKLVIIYEGLDFSRKPLPASQIDGDIGYFVQKYAQNPVFQVFGKPAVIWSGTWQFSRQDIAGISQKYRDQILLLATEKNTAGYERIADLVDGDAYYWSSVNPETNTGYETKLGAMAQAIHNHQGLWIAPAAPGFDARQVGGTTVVDRKSGDTLRQQMNVAVQSSPDAIGIISWNEFSENTYIEPSQKLGDQSLKVLADMTNTKPPDIPNFDSSDPADTTPSLGLDRIAALLGLGGLILASTLVIVGRRGAKHKAES